jgi:Kdo2-lipid IVA lauroyltransferase/acyltransferase
MAIESAAERFPLSFHQESERDRWRKGITRPWLAVKDLIWLVYLFPARWLARLLPAGWMIELVQRLDPVAQLLIRGRKRVLLSRLELGLGSRAAAADIAQRYFRNALVRAGDDLILDRLVSGNGIRCLEFRGRKHLEEALAEGHGAILLTGHFFANRLAKCYLASLGFPPLSVRNSQSREPSSGRLGMRLVRPRYDAFLHSVIRDEVSIQDPECTLKILKRLRENGIVNIHLDVSVSSQFAMTSFLGNAHQLFPTGFLRIARRLKTPILPTLCLGNSRGIQIEIEERFPMTPADGERELYQNNLPGLIARLESQILRHPDQWELWIRI